MWRVNTHAVIEVCQHGHSCFFSVERFLGFVKVSTLLKTAAWGHTWINRAPPFFAGTIK